MTTYIDEMRRCIEEKTGQSFDSIDFQTPGDDDEYDVSLTGGNIALISGKILTKKDVDEMVDKAISWEIK
jgi:hypothetical protein